MQLTIIAPDNFVIIDGKGHSVDCSALAGIHAVQWNGSAGVVEYTTIDGNRAPNADITDISPYQAQIDAWTAAENYVPPPPPPPTVTELIGYANRAQWAKATGGYAVTVNGTQITMPTSTESLSLINGKFARLQQPNPPTSIAWQIGPTTFVDIPAADFNGIAVAVADFVQSTFDTLRSIVIPAVLGGTITTTAEIDQAFS